LVTDLNERGFTARPVVLFVNESNVLEKGDEIVEVAVDVPDGD
jgi:hypothetical protein